jgi:hypothetical protein
LNARTHMHNLFARYTSAVAPTGAPLHVEVSLFNSDTSINGFEWVTKQDAWCSGVTCASPGPCTSQPEQCVLGLCSGATYLPVNATCSDGNASTSNDMCRADHTCAGVDLCVQNNVTCPANPNCAAPPVCYRGECLPCTDLCANVRCANATQCSLAETCSRGVCVAAQPRPNGTSCDDGVQATTWAVQRHRVSLGWNNMRRRRRCNRKRHLQRSGRMRWC